MKYFLLILLIFFCYVWLLCWLEDLSNKRRIHRIEEAKKQAELKKQREAAAEAKKRVQEEKNLKRKIIELNANGFVSCVHQAIVKSFCDIIECKIKHEIYLHHYKPDAFSIWKSVTGWTQDIVCVNNNCVGIYDCNADKYRYIYYNSLGYVNITQEQEVVLIHALNRYLYKWDCSGKWHLKPNSRYWQHYIKLEIDRICDKKGLNPLSKV